MKLVVDANVLLAVALAEPERDHVVRLSEGHRLFAPQVLPYEIANAISALVKRNGLALKDAEHVWDATLKMAVETRPIDIKSALRIATSHRLYALRCLLHRMRH